MIENPDKFDDGLTTEPTTNLGFLGEVKIHQDAEDTVTIRLISRDTSESVDFQVSDESMIMFAEATKAAFSKIHGGMASMSDVFNRSE